MKYLISFLSIAFIASCATYTPEQLQAKATDKTDFDLCFDMVLPNPNQYSKQELMNREVDCSEPDIAPAVIEKRRKQIVLGQALSALGNSMKQQSAMNVPSANTLPNYSKNNTNIKKYLTSQTISNDGRYTCTYGVGITSTVIVKYAKPCASSI